MGCFCDSQTHRILAFSLRFIIPYRYLTITLGVTLVKESQKNVNFVHTTTNNKYCLILVDPVVNGVIIYKESLLDGQPKPWNLSVPII